MVSISRGGGRPASLAHSACQPPHSRAAGLNSRRDTVTVISTDELVEILRQALPAGVFVSGLVCDVATGLIETVVAPARVV
jgi:hypothetical protein